MFFPTFLGAVLEEVRTDYARMRLPYRPELRQPAGVVHGGVIATLADTVVVPAVGSAYDEARQLFTVDMQVRYLAPIVEEDAVAEGWVTQRGRSLVFCDAEVRSASGTLAASATLVYKVSSRPQVLE
ncbi:MAG: PaaI family thioesterase [Acidimicrobiia bacterium]